MNFIELTLYKNDCNIKVKISISHIVYFYKENDKNCRVGCDDGRDILVKESYSEIMCKIQDALGTMTNNRLI